MDKGLTDTVNLFKEANIFQVLDLVGASEKAQKPSDADLFYPELWKGEQWRWFIETQQPSEEILEPQE